MAPTFMDVRTTQPMNALAKIPGVTTEMLIREMKVEPIKDKSIPHILILQRHIPQDVKAWKEKMLRVADMGWLVISEWDDHPDKLPPGIRERFGEAGWLAFSAAHAVQTSTEFLAESLKKYNNNILIFKNSIDCESIKIKDYSKPIVFFGALNRKNDWLQIIDKMNEFNKKNKYIEYNIVHDKEFFESLCNCKKRYYGTLTRDKYFEVLRNSTHVLMPLEDTFNNQCKSDLKFIEATATNNISIISGVTYENQIPSENMYFNIRKYKDIATLMSDATSESGIRRLNLAREYVNAKRSVLMDANYRYKSYAKLFINKDNLNQELIDRLK